MKVSPLLVYGRIKWYMVVVRPAPDNASEVYLAQAGSKNFNCGKLSQQGQNFINGVKFYTHD